MKRNMKQWVTDYINAPAKKGMPILSFPGIQLIGHTVEELVRSGELQAQCMKAIADRFDTGVAFSLMDLSVEAEAFGAPVHYSEDEVPTVHGTLINDEDEAEALKVPKVGDGRTGNGRERSGKSDRISDRICKGIQRSRSKRCLHG